MKVTRSSCRLLLTALLACAAVLTCAALCGLAEDRQKHDTDRTKPLDQAAKTAARKALEPLNPFIGGWRGAGQVRRGSRAGAWLESGVFVWNFANDQVAVQYDVKDGKQIRTAQIHFDTQTRAFVMQATFADKVKRRYTGKREKNVFVFEAEPDPAGYVSRVTLRQLNEKRMLVLYEARKASQSFYRRLGEVGYTRKGTRLAASGSTGPQCVVTGGAGTIAVSHKGKTYYVCCTGCRDAFNDDPEGILAEYRQKLEQQKKKKG